MINNEDIKTYLSLNRVFGSSTEFVQGPGGNISVKNGNEIIVKTSGTCLGETQTYEICDLMTLRKCLSDKNDSVKDAVLHGSGTPSMEAYFHTLPKRLCIHLHPISIPLLLQKEDPSIPGILWIPYKQPGIELAEEILKKYYSESILLFQNHGVLLLADTVDELFTQVEILYRYSSAQYITKKLLNTLYLYSQRDTGYFYRHCPFAKGTIDLTKAITPDSVVFLNSDTLLRIEDEWFARSTSWKQTHSIAEIFYAYTYLLENATSSVSLLSTDDIEALKNNKKEKHRLNLKN
jgi:ribulose-5-phosphate 4-epimerase/fuculose-1-phosphate aldolase